MNLVKGDLPNLPPSYDIFKALQDFIHGERGTYSPVMVSELDKFSGILFHIMEAFNKYLNDSNAFAEEIYAAKRLARYNKLHQLEYFCDLLIGYAYINLESYDKASLIIYKIIRATGDNGMTNLTYAAWYLMSEMSLRQGRYTVAYGIVNNSLIQLEKADNSNEYLLMLFKYQMYKVLMFKGHEDKAQICIAQCGYLTQKYGIKFTFDTDPSHYIPLEDPDDESNLVNSGVGAVQRNTGSAKQSDKEESEE